jgi:hypothetical protein
MPDLILPDGDGGMAGPAWLSTATLNSDHLAIVPPSDARVLAIRAAVPAADALLSGFTDSYGHAVLPSALICRTAFPDLVGRQAEAIIAFRNAVALSVVLRTRAVVASGDGAMGPIWTDVFDLHPTTINRLGELYTGSPAMLDIRGQGQRFYGTQSPFVTARVSRLLIDSALYRELGAKWQHRYMDRALDDERARSLFRSLEVAYRASSLGRVSLPSIHDVGVQIALWVSAIEILVWPTAHKANWRLAVDLLGSYRWHVSALDDSLYDVFWQQNKPPIRGNAVQRAYALINKVRNDFLHGEPVNDQTLTPALAAGSSLILLAAIVYRTALAGFLGVTLVGLPGTPNLTKPTAPLDMVRSLVTQQIMTSLVLHTATTLPGA